MKEDSVYKVEIYPYYHGPNAARKLEKFYNNMALEGWKLFSIMDRGRDLVITFTKF